MSGGCRLLCDPGFADCDGSEANGCEANIVRDLDHCGGCTVVCPGGICAGGRCARRVFVTNAIRPGNVGGVAGADAICGAEASAAGLSGTYLAWISSSTTSPAVRMTRDSRAFARPDGVLIANDWADLTDGNLAAPIERNAAGGTPASACNTNASPVWTATDPTGHSSGASCVDWTNASDMTHPGFYYQSDARWTQVAGNYYCSYSVGCSGAADVGGHFYCMEQ